MWKDIKNAPKIIGDPLWVKGNDFGKPDGNVHYCWAYWDGTDWREQGNKCQILQYLTHYKSPYAKIF